MTVNAIEHRPAGRSHADTSDLHEAVTFTAGFMETVRIVGLRLAGYEAWAAAACAVVAVACLAGVTELAVALISPALTAAVPMNCGSSVDCARQTMGLLP